MSKKDKRIKELEDAITSALENLGEEGGCRIHNCAGCDYEHDEAVSILKEVMGAKTVWELTERRANSAIEGFKEGLKDAMEGRVFPIEELWKSMDVPLDSEG